MAVIYLKSSLENNITNLKSCQKRIANSDESLSCSDCMCIATDGFSSKEFLDIVEKQKEGEENYKKLKNELSEYKEKVIELEGKLSKYENPNKDFKELFDNNWSERKDILINEINEKETSLQKSLMDKVEEEVQSKSQQIRSQLNQQSGDITKTKGTAAFHMYSGFIYIYMGIQFVEELKSQFKGFVNLW